MQVMYSSSGGGMLALMEALKGHYQVASWNDVGFFLHHLKLFARDRLIVCAHGPEDMLRLQRSGRVITHAILNTRNPREGMPSLIRKRLFSRMVGDAAARAAAHAGPLPTEYWSEADIKRLASYFDFGGQINEMRRMGPEARFLIVDMAELMPAACPETERQVAAYFGLPSAEGIRIPTHRVNTWAFFLTYPLALKLDLGIPVEVSFAASAGMTRAMNMRQLMVVPQVPFADRPGGDPYLVDLEVYWRPLGASVTEPSMPILTEMLHARFMAQFDKFREWLETTLQQGLAATEAAISHIDLNAAAEAAWAAFAPEKQVLYALRPDLAQIWEAT